MRLISRAIAAAAVFCGLGASASADPAMWVVKDADSTVYLLGTIHALKSDVDWQSPKLETAFKASDEYWMEADVDADPAAVQSYVMNFGTDPQHPLQSKLDPADYAKLTSIAGDLNIPADQLAQMRPWLAMIALTTAQAQKIGYNPDNGVDITLERSAKAQGKAIRAFETASQQLGFFSSLPQKLEVEMLVQTLREMDAGPKLLDEMEQDWLAGDTEQLDRVGFADMRKEMPQLYDVVIKRRNADWAKQIEAMMRGAGTHFIAVGAGHLSGPDSVPTLLKAAGYRVERY